MATGDDAGTTRTYLNLAMFEVTKPKEWMRFKPIHLEARWRNFFFFFQPLSSFHPRMCPFKCTSNWRVGGKLQWTSPSSLPKDLINLHVSMSTSRLPLLAVTSFFVFRMYFDFVTSSPPFRFNEIELKGHFSVESKNVCKFNLKDSLFSLPF